MKAKFIERRINQLTRRRNLSEIQAWQLIDARLALRAWVAWEVNGNMSQGIIWRPKRDGGPYRLEIQ